MRAPAALRRALATPALALLTLAPALPARAAPVRLPPYTRTTLKNGLTLFVMPVHRLPLVDLRLVADAGAVDDPRGKEGLAGLTADLMTQGAGPRDARRLAEDIAFVGGTLDASAGSEQLVVTCEVLRKDLATGLELFHDVVVSPTFEPADVERDREEVLAAIAGDLDDPSEVADRAELPFLMGDHPLGHPVSGWARSVRTLTRDDVVAFHRAHVTPERCLLAVVGDVDPEGVRAALERAFADWRRAGEPPAPAYGALPALPRAVRIVEKPELTQSQIRLLGLGVPRSHPDYFPIVVANTILGGGFTSRLVEEVRVSQGLTYGIGSQFAMYRGTGSFDISTFTRNETLRKTIDEVLKVVGRLVDEGPTEDELAKAKRYLTGQFPLGLQAPDALAARILDIAFYGLDPKFVETYAERVDAVSMTDCRRALKAYFVPADLRILVVSPPAVAKPALAGLGPIDTVPPD